MSHPTHRRAARAVLALALAAAACAMPAAKAPPPTACVFSTRGGLVLLCCPDESGKRNCVLSRGGQAI